MVSREKNDSNIGHDVKIVESHSRSVTSDWLDSLAVAPPTSGPVHRSAAAIKPAPPKVSTDEPIGEPVTEPVGEPVGEHIDEQVNTQKFEESAAHPNHATANAVGKRAKTYSRVVPKLRAKTPSQPSPQPAPVPARIDPDNAHEHTRNQVDRLAETTDLAEVNQAPATVPVATAASTPKPVTRKVSAPIPAPRAAPISAAPSAVTALPEVTTENQKLTPDANKAVNKVSSGHSRRAMDTSVRPPASVTTPVGTSNEESGVNSPTTRTEPSKRRMAQSTASKRATRTKQNPVVEPAEIVTILGPISGSVDVKPSPPNLNSYHVPKLHSEPAAKTPISLPAPGKPAVSIVHSGKTKPIIDRASTRSSKRVKAAAGAAAISKSAPLRINMTSVQEALNHAMAIDGALGVTLVDLSSGLTLGTAGGGENLDLEIASAGNSDVLRAKLRTLDALGIDDRIEDILITLTNQYHLVRVISSGGGGLFLYLVLDKHTSNLAMARHRLTQIEQSLQV